MLVTFEDMLNHYSNAFYKTIDDFIKYLNSEIYLNDEEEFEKQDNIEREEK